MEWNCCWSVNNTFLFESTGDSEDGKSDVHHDHEDDETVMDESEGESFIRFYDEDDVDVNDDDDDAQSCSYDNHSSNVNTIYGDTQYDQSQKQIYDDHEDGNIDDGVINMISDDDMNKNWGLSKQPNKSPKFCADSSNQRENDREFWEACLAT